MEIRLVFSARPQGATLELYWILHSDLKVTYSWIRKNPDAQHAGYTFQTSSLGHLATLKTSPMSDLPPTDTPAKKPHVLLVDDDAEIIESMRYALEANGFHVTIARDGNQGLALAENTTPDLLILDMMMPKRSGFLVLEQLRRNGHDKVRVIMVTGNEGNRHKQYAELLGVDDYIRKPFPMDRLIESALKLVSKDAGSSTAHAPGSSDTTQS